MTNQKLKTPVTFIIFNRPDTTKKVFEVIRQVKPPKLLVIADGPRADRSGEAEKCAAARAIIERVDWDCEVLKNYSEANLGCMRRVSSGLDWVFKTVEEAIVLEDDCLPDPTFFSFCEELLDYYRDDERIMSIGGVNFQFGRTSDEYSYYFSVYHDCWGWATWRRAWQYRDIEMKFWPQFRDSNFLQARLSNLRTAKYWENAFQSTYDGRINSWFYRWLLSCWLQNGLGIFPQVNLISNIGCGADATHTKVDLGPYANMKTEAIRLPLTHPTVMVQNWEADRFTQETRFDPTLARRAKGKMNKIWNKLNSRL